MPAKGQITNVIERIKAKTIYQGNCWLFTGKKVGMGYGCIWYKGKMTRINRLICHLYHGANLDILWWTANHKNECEYKNCWNPEHIYVGDMKSNVMDSIRKGTFHYGTGNLNIKGSVNDKTGRKF